MNYIGFILWYCILPRTLLWASVHPSFRSADLIYDFLKATAWINNEVVLQKLCLKILDFGGENGARERYFYYTKWQSSRFNAKGHSVLFFFKIVLDSKICSITNWERWTFILWWMLGCCSHNQFSLSLCYFEKQQFLRLHFLGPMLESGDEI